MPKGPNFPGGFRLPRFKLPINTVTQILVSPPGQKELKKLTKRASKCVRSMYYAMNGNIVAIITVVVVVMLSFLLPDLTQKLHANPHELKSMRKVLDKMSNEVKRAEAACLTVADEICNLQCNMHDDTTETSKQRVQDLSVCTSHCMRTTQSEPAHVDKKMGFFRRIFFPNRNASHKEITLMSYLYTDSFDGKASEQPQISPNL
ncbi:uncharacterized protein LOC124633513 [Helicoverpa zea]|uniref:uncharacterized protein LOC124633513 n=1 Tax=Helicoverpa zea TaxID=7113 RepID=UPI001F5964BA|nr:uncharacterized protein LOC124633513 [Helicoverpa zea]